MGCASSGARALCKGQGVENDKMGYGKSAVNHPDTQSAVAGITRSGTDIINSINDYGVNRVSHDEPDDMSTLVKNGRDMFDSVKHNAFEKVQDFAEKAEDVVETGAGDLMHRGTSAVENAADTIEEQVSKAAESVMSKVEELKADIKDSFDSTKSKETEIKEDVDKKIDDLLANIEESS